MILPGSYMEGFAPRDFAPAFPELWQGRVASFCPSLGITGAAIQGWAGARASGTISGPTWEPREGRISLFHTNSTDYVNFGTASEVTGISQMSVSFWMRFASLVSGCRLVGKWAASAAGQSWIVQASGTDKLLFAIFDGAGYTGFETTNAVLSTGSWTHIVAILDSPIAMRFFVNGQQVAVTSLFASAVAGPQVTAGNGTRVGDLGDGGVSFDGGWDDLSLYNRVLNPNAIKLLATRPGIAHERERRAKTAEFVGGTAYTLTADQGSFTYTGQASALQAARRLAAAQGSYTLTGQAASLIAARIMSAAQGAYTLTGQAASLAVARRLAAGHGSYTLTGQDASLVASQALTLIAEQGSFALSGQAAGLTVARRLSAEAGTFALTGQAAVLKAARRIAAGQGSIVVTGQDVTLTYSGAAVVVPAMLTSMEAFRHIIRQQQLLT